MTSAPHLAWQDALWATRMARLWQRNDWHQLWLDGNRLRDNGLFRRTALRAWVRAELTETELAEYRSACREMEKWGYL